MKKVDNSKNMRGRTRLVWISSGLLFAFLPFVQSVWPVDGRVHESLEIAGIVFVVMCIGGRVFCSAYIGGRKNYELVTTGPYSVVRNPLYVFSLFGAAGIGLLTGMTTVAILASGLFFVIHQITVLREEALLVEAGGLTYADYKSRTPRWFPRFSLWQQPDEILVRPHFLYHTLRDIWWLVLFIPLMEVIDLLQVADLLPVFFRLP